MSTKSIATYARTNRLTLTLAFRKAWRHRYAKLRIGNPCPFDLAEDVQRYVDCGAVPPYVQLFMEERGTPELEARFARRQRVPYWMTLLPWYARF